MKKIEVDFNELVDDKILSAINRKLNYLITETLSEPDAGERSVIVKVKIKPKGDGASVLLKVEIDKAEPKDPKDEFVRLVDFSEQGDLFTPIKAVR